jgi:hypothetical protein
MGAEKMRGHRRRLQEKRVLQRKGKTMFQKK